MPVLNYSIQLRIFRRETVIFAARFLKRLVIASSFNWPVVGKENTAKDGPVVQCPPADRLG